jgi:hypothetical protein
LPAEYLIPVVRYLSTIGIQLTMEELDRISESSALASAPSNRLGHHRAKESTGELHGPGNPIDEQHSLKLRRGGIRPARRQTLIQRLAKMTVAQRVQFAMKGGLEARRAHPRQ